MKKSVIQNNIQLFKYIIAKAIEKDPLLIQCESQEYKAFIHRDSGYIRFTPIHSDEKPLWIPLSFTLYHLHDSKIMGCEVKAGAIASAISSQAQDVLDQTVKTIRLMARMLPRLQTFPKLLEAFSIDDLEIDQAKKDDPDLIHHAWHDLDRLETEALLSRYPVGSYLFRKDGFAVILEHQLQTVHHEGLICITLSYVADKDQISEVTLVHAPDGWLMYNDDPNLREGRFEKIEDLLKGLNTQLRYPLLQ